MYWVGGQTQWEAVFGGVGFFAFGFGLSAWGKYLLPQGPFVEERHDLRSTEPEIEAMAAAIEDRGKMVFRRRGFLGTILGAGAGVMGVVLAFPLLRSLGPSAQEDLRHHRLAHRLASSSTSTASASTRPTSRWVGRSRSSPRDSRGPR